MEIVKKKILRLKYLRELYEASKGSTANFVNLYELGSHLDLDESQSHDVARALHDFELAKIQTKDGLLTITRQGIQEIENNPLPESIKVVTDNNSSLNDMSFWKYLHPRVRELSQERFEMGYFADAILVCMREINSKLKQLAKHSGRDERDGADLITNVFSLKNPLISFADLTTETGRNIQLGYMKIFEGAMIGIRNPKSHENMYPDEAKTIHFLFIASFMILKLEEFGVKV